MEKEINEKTLTSAKSKTKRMSGRKKAEIIFLICLLALPLGKFFVMYVCVNFNSILLAFQKYTPEGKYVFWGLGNFKEVFEVMSGAGELSYGVKNSLLAYVFGLVVGTPLSLIFSYYVYKKRWGSTAFKIALFLPSLISNLVDVLMFQYFVEDGLSAIIGFNLLTTQRTSFGTLLFFSIWVGFGSGIIMYSNSMSKVDPSIIESAVLEGITPFKEFWYISFPAMYPTLTAMMVIGISSIFSSQLNLYPFFGSSAQPYNYTVGYYFFIKVLGDTGISEYPFAAAAGLVFTAVCVPLTLGLRYVLEHFGPSED